jgi:hypothetical protein
LIYELYSDASLMFYPEDGEQIIMVGDLSFEQLDCGLIQVSSGARRLVISPRSGATGAMPNGFFY